jgi:predicted CopG family antitoxin
MSKAIKIKKEVYEKLEKLKTELGAESFSEVIEKLITTYESMKKHQDFTQLLQDLEGFYNIWERIRGKLLAFIQQ